MDGHATRCVASDILVSAFKVDGQIRSGYFLGQRLVDAVVHFKLITLQIDAREQGILVKSVVGDQVGC